MATGQRQRTTREGFGDYMRPHKQGGTETDIALNYADELIVLGGPGGHRGRDGVRETARTLDDLMPDSSTSEQAAR